MSGEPKSGNQVRAPKGRELDDRRYSTERGELAPWMRDRSLLPKVPPTKSGHAYEPRGGR